MAFHISVSNSSLPDWPTPTSAYLPVLHHFSLPHPDSTIHLLDVVELWKDLSPKHAIELRFWYNSLRATFERYFHDTLVANLRENGVSADAWAVHDYVSSLGHQSVHIDIDNIIDSVVKQQQKASHESANELFARDTRVALVNLLRTWHCFMDDEPTAHLFFYSEVVPQGGVHIYIKVENRPHVFYADHKAGTFVFRSPVLDAGKGAYEVVVGDAKRVGDVWELSVVTRFQEARFERLYRFINDVKVKVCNRFLPIRTTPRELTYHFSHLNKLLYWERLCQPKAKRQPNVPPNHPLARTSARSRKTQSAYRVCPISSAKHERIIPSYTKPTTITCSAKLAY
jgi:hypothetical protein